MEFTDGKFELKETEKQSFTMKIKEELNMGIIVKTEFTNIDYNYHDKTIDYVFR